MNRVTKELAKEAKKNGICTEWYYQLRTLEDKEKLIEMYLKGIDFCLLHDYPSNDFIRVNFKGIMEKYGVHLDEEININNERKVVALGKCSGIVKVDQYTISEVFLKHDSELNISAEGQSFIMIDMFDNTKLRVDTYDNAKVCINRYGGEIEFHSLGNSVVKVKEKNKKTY